MLPVDDALLHLLVDPRAVVPKVNDNLWVRLLDLPVALAGRRYAAPVDVVLEVTDTRLPANAGRWRLTTGAPEADGTYAATVVRTHDDADLRARRPRARCRLPGRSLAGGPGARRPGGRGDARRAADRGGRRSGGPSRRCARYVW